MSDGSKRGARPSESATLVGPVLDQPMTQEEIDKRAAIARAESQLPIDQIAFSQRVGGMRERRKLMDVFKKISDVTDILELSKIKQSKEYKGLRYFDGEKVVTVTTWADFCASIVGRSVEQVDEDIRNLSRLGGETMEAMQKIGAGYRDLRALRNLPEGDRAMVVAAAQSGDIEDLRIALEDAEARHQAEKKRLEGELSEARDDLAAKDQRASVREREVERLGKELRKARRALDEATPDQTAQDLRHHASAAAHDVRAKIIARGDDVSSLRTRAEQLLSHGRDTGVDQSVFLAGLFAEIERDLAALRDELGIEATVAADGTPEWLKQAQAAGEV